MPPSRKHLSHPRFTEALIDQKQHTTVLVAANDPTSRLNDLAHARVQVRVVETAAKLPGQTLLELFVDRIDGRQTEGGNKGANQPGTGQVHPFSEGAAQYSETDPSPIRHETRQKPLACGLVHARRLPPVRHLGVALGKQNAR